MPHTPPRPDPRPVLDALGYRDARAISPLSGGWDNFLWRFDTIEGERLVLRLFRPTERVERLAAVAANETAAMRAAAAGGLPVPEVRAEATFEGAPAMVLTWMPGQPLADMIKKHPWRARSWGREFGRLQARLHRSPVDGVRLLTSAGWENRAHDPVIQAAKHELSDDLALCHLDFHPLNVLAHGRDISALLDFRNAAAGDRRADLGLTWALLEAAPLPPGLAMRVTRVVLRRFVAGWREGYTTEAGDFPLTPLFQAAGLAIYHREFSRALAEGRGWATQAHVNRLAALLEDRKRAAGL